MQTENIEYKIYLGKLKSSVRGHYSRIVEITGQPKSNISDVLSGKTKNTPKAKAILKAAVQVRDELMRELKKEEDAITKLIS